MGKFVNLHVHTEFSMLDSMIKVEDLFDECKKRGDSAVGITDHGNMTAVFDAYKSYKRTGIKFIPGIEAYFIHDIENEKERSKHLVLLAMNEQGYKNIMRLNYEGFNHKRMIFGKVYPRIGWDLLKKYNEGIICLSACVNGVLARHILADDAKSTIRDAKRFLDIFGDRFYLEVQPHNLKDGDVDQRKVNQSMYGLYKELGIPMVATNDCHFLTQEDYKYQDMLLAIGDKKPLDDPGRKKYINEFYLKGYQDILNYFGDDLGKQLCATSVEIANFCEPPDYLKSEGYKMPKFPIKDEPDYKEFLKWQTENVKDVEETAAYLRYKCIQDFQKFDFGEKTEEYWERIKKEIKVIENKGLSSYMLIVADYIKAAKERDCVVGPGRGSSCGSLVAMITGITEIDPMEYDLMFERFINPKREQLADIDTDFSHPQIVKDYLVEKYGREYVASIANIIFMRPKVVVKDIARSLRIEGEKTFEVANKITSTIPDDIKTVEEAFEVSGEFKRWMLKYPEVYTYAIKLQNLPRQHGIHAAGMIISDRPLPESIPLKIDRHGVVATQYEKDRVESSGYLKVDILGLETLTVLKSVREIIKAQGKSVPDVIPINDKKTYDLISAGDTTGVFQLEASLKPLCQTLKPKSISEISDINALGRPGCPPEERQDFINRKLGKIKSEPLHPKLKGVLHRTHDKCVYEEDLLALGQHICGWNLGRADIMRRICKGKEKTRHLLPKLKEDFVKDAYINGVSKSEAEKLFEIVNYFSSYGFNRSHAVAYSTISYRSAYFKAHYPTEFMTALINSENSNSDKIKIYQTEMRLMGIEILPPDLNKSDYLYSIEGKKKIRMGLSCLKGVGEKGIESIVNNRPYKTFLDFVSKVEHRVVNIRTVNTLINAGCFEGFGINRRTLYENYADYKKKYQAAVKKEKLKIYKELYAEVLELYNHNAGLPKKTKPEKECEFVPPDKDAIEVGSIKFEYDFPKTEEWNLAKKLENEREVLGDYISGSINDVYGDFFKRDPKMVNLGELSEIPDGHVVRFEGVIRKKVKTMKVKKTHSKMLGQEFGKYLIEDLSKNLAEMTVFPQKYKEYGGVFSDNTPIICTCEISSFNGKKDLTLRNVVKI